MYRSLGWEGSGGRQKERTDTVGSISAHQHVTLGACTVPKMHHDASIIMLDTCNGLVPLDRDFG